MRRLLVIGILIIAILLPVYAATNKPQKSEPVPSTWLMELPAGWIPTKSNFPRCLMVIYDSNHMDHLASMNVVYDVVGNMTLDQVFKAGEKSAPKVMQNYKLWQYGDTKVGGLPAYYVITTQTNSEVGTIESKCFVVIRKGIAYTFTFGCLQQYFSSHSKDFNSVISSIKWVEKPKK